jgi:hypothetical protein
MNCIFCKNKMDKLYNLNKTISGHYVCKNHTHIVVEFYVPNEMNWIYLRNKKTVNGYSIYILYPEQRMKIFKLHHNMNDFIMINSVDKHITPENFEERIEKYLIFT